MTSERKFDVVLLPDSESFGDAFARTLSQRGEGTLDFLVKPEGTDVEEIDDLSTLRIRSVGYISLNGTEVVFEGRTAECDLAAEDEPVAGHVDDATSTGLITIG